MSMRRLAHIGRKLRKDIKVMVFHKLNVHTIYFQIFFISSVAVILYTLMFILIVFILSCLNLNFMHAIDGQKLFRAYVLLLYTVMPSLNKICYPILSKVVR